MPLGTAALHACAVTVVTLPWPQPQICSSMGPARTSARNPLPTRPAAWLLASPSLLLTPPRPTPPRCRCPRPLSGPVRWAHPGATVALLLTSARPAPPLRAGQFSLSPDPRPPPGQAHGAGLGTAWPDRWRSACCEPDPALGASGSLPEQVPTRGRPPGPSTWPWARTGWAPSWLVLCGTNGALGGLVPAAAGYAAGMGGFPGEPGWGGRVRGWGRGSAQG